MRYRLSLLLVCLLIFAGCGREPDVAAAFSMDTYVEIEVYDGLPAREYLARINDLADIFSRTTAISDIYRINASEGEAVTVEPETIDILEKCRTYYELSNGLIDPTIGTVSKLWDFGGTGRNPDKRIPNQESLDFGLQYVGFDKLVIEGNTVRKTNPYTELDLGFIAKGYIGGKVLENEDGNILMDLGGNIAVCGEKEGRKPYKIGIKKPFSENEVLLTIELTGKKFVVTSGIYERCFELNGKLYHHILDVNTGYPVDNELCSVTIIADDGTAADALSTTCFVLGTEKGMELIENTEGTEALFIDKDMNLTFSSGFPEYEMK